MNGSEHTFTDAAIHVLRFPDPWILATLLICVAALGGALGIRLRTRLSASRAVLVTFGSMSLLFVLGRGSTEFDHWHVHPVRGTAVVLLEPLFGCRGLVEYKSRFEQQPEKDWTAAGWESSTAQPDCRFAIFLTSILSVALKSAFVFLAAFVFASAVRLMRARQVEPLLESASPPEQATSEDMAHASNEVASLSVLTNAGYVDQNVPSSGQSESGQEPEQDPFDRAFEDSTIDVVSDGSIGKYKSRAADCAATREDREIRALLAHLSKFFSKRDSKSDPLFSENARILFNMVEAIASEKGVLRGKVVIGDEGDSVELVGGTIRRTKYYGLASEKVRHVFQWLASFPGYSQRRVIAIFVAAHDKMAAEVMPIKMAEAGSGKELEPTRIFEGFTDLVDRLRAESENIPPLN